MNATTMELQYGKKMSLFIVSQLKFLSEIETKTK